MGTEGQEAAIPATLLAVFRLIGSRDLQQRLRTEQFEAALAELKLPADEDTRDVLLEIVNRVDVLVAERAPAAPSTSGGASAATGDPNDPVAKILLGAFGQINRSFGAALAMSVILFVVGLILLAIAVVRSLGEGEVSTSTLTIAGLGLADFVLVFYRRPWQDVAANLYVSQQVRIIATSYLAGLSLVERQDREGAEALERLTRCCIELLERSRAGAPPGQRRGSLLPRRPPDAASPRDEPQPTHEPAGPPPP